jgi:hypothetical protein
MSSGRMTHPETATHGGLTEERGRELGAGERKDV